MKWHAGWDMFLLGVCALGIFFSWQKEQAQLVEQMAEQTSLHPKVENMQEELKQQAAEKDIQLVITEGYRTEKRQNNLYAQGRSEEGNIVTYAEGGESYHNYGLAIDIALRNAQGTVIWDTEYDGNGNGTSDWMEVVEMAKDIGFEWGGDWDRFEDVTHLQWDAGTSIRELQRENQDD